MFGPDWHGKNSFKPDPPPVYGDLVLDEDEKQALMLEPKFAIYQKLDEEEFECELETTFCKLRWERMKEGDEDEEDCIETTPEEKEAEELAEASTRSVYDPHRKEIDLRKSRATDIKLNTEIFLPRQQGQKFETLLGQEHPIGVKLSELILKRMPMDALTWLAPVVLEEVNEGRKVMISRE